MLIRHNIPAQCYELEDNFQEASDQLKKALTHDGENAKARAVIMQI